MKPALKRIEETLKQLETLKNAANPDPGLVDRRAYSFEICHDAPQSNFTTPKLSSTTKTSVAIKPLELPNLHPASTSCTQTIQLLAATTSELTDLYPASSCTQSVTALDPTDVTDEVKLAQVVAQIQDLYHDGPIVNGWLEYYPPLPEPEDSTLREVCFERALDYEAVGTAPGSEVNVSIASYRLCALDASGQQWSYICPMEQLPSVSMAIARYQKLQQLLQQKQELEK